MADLNEVVKQVTQKFWDRAKGVVVKNEFGKAPELQFLVETACLTDGTQFTSVAKGVAPVKFNLSETYPLINPKDDSVIPDEALLTLPRHLQIQVLLYSQFKHTVK